MKINGEINEDEIVEFISDKWLLNTMKEVTEDATYSQEEKYIILEGYLKHWGKEDNKKPTER